MSKEIEQLVKLSQKLGNDIDQIQAAGGNTSFKNDEFVWVKGSGQELKYAGRESFVQCYRSKLEENLSKTYSQNPDISTGEAKDDLMAIFSSHQDLITKMDSGILCQMLFAQGEHWYLIAKFKSQYIIMRSCQSEPSSLLDTGYKVLKP